MKAIISPNKRLTTSGLRVLSGTAGTVVAVAVILLGIRYLSPSHATIGAPSSGTPICGQTVLNSPYSYNGAAGSYTSGTAGLPTYGTAGSDFPAATAGLVVAAGNNTPAASSGTYEVNNTVVYFEPGTHTIQTGMYTGHNSVYIGGYSASAGKAILNGVDGATNGTGKGGSPLSYSKPSSGSDVYDTWEYLTIENYTSSRNNSVMGNINGGASDVGDTYLYDTIGPNDYGYQGSGTAPATGESSGGGYAIDAGSNTTIKYDCLNQNAQGGFNVWAASGLTISNNEISKNGLGEYPDTGGPGASPYGCGCSGGGKAFFTANATVTYNYVHDNYNTGIWFDFDNTGANISYNYVASNWGAGIMYEASYNANISNNTLVGNGWASNGAWPAGVGGGACYGGVSCTNGNGPITGAGGGNPYGAIDLSDSGGNSNLNAMTLPNCSSNCSVTSNYSGQLLVQNNVLTNNFGGVKVYTDTNRYPGNIDNDSACSVPLGALNMSNNTTYYQQTKELVTNGDATISGSSVTVGGGTKTVCANYGQTQSQQSDSYANAVTQAPSVGMAVFDQDTGALLGTIASVGSANSFTLSGSPGNRSGANLMISAYGGCGAADYYGGGIGKASGSPSANYWDNCIWGGRNVTVSGNNFSMQPSAMTGCTTVNMCGFMMNEAFNAGVPALMQFFDSYTSLVAKASGGLGNVWSSNTYSYVGSGGPGSWQFMAGTQGNQATQAAWQAAPYGQDVGSTFGSNSYPAPATPNNVSAVANSSSSVTVSWVASTDSGGPGLGGYYILRNGVQVGTANSSTLNYTDTTVAAGTQYSYTVEAYDTANPVDVSAASLAAVVTTPASSQAPSVSVTSTSNNAALHGGNVAITSTATPGSGNSITQAQLLINNSVVQTVSSSPYNFTLNTLNYKDGSYTLTVKATDNQSNVGTSNVTILITNGDLNGDNKVDISDLAIMAAHWGQTDSSYAHGNILGQATINISDLAVLANNWGRTW